MNIQSIFSNPFDGVVVDPTYPDPMDIVSTDVPSDLPSQEDVEKQVDSLIKKFSFTLAKNRPSVSVLADSPGRAYSDIRLKDGKILFAEIHLPASYSNWSTQALEFTLAHEIAHIEQLSEPPTSWGESIWRTVRPYEGMPTACTRAVSFGSLVGTMWGKFKGTIPWRTVFRRSPLAIPFLIGVGVDYESRKLELDADRRAALALKNCNGGIERFTTYSRIVDKIVIPYHHTHPTSSVRVAQLKKIQKEFE